MPTISVTDLNNAKLDVDHIAELATSASPTATDRLGNTKMTLAGAISSVATINNRGAWVAATTYAIKDVVLSSGTWYICIVAHTSSALFSTDLAANWRVYQGVTSAELQSGFSGRIQATGFATDTALPGANAQFYSREYIEEHAHYAFLDDSSLDFSVGSPPYGHASFNSNVKLVGSTDTDHHHGFQSYPHIEGTATVDRVSGFYSIGETLDGTVTEWSHFRADDPTGAGTVTTQYGVYIAELTQGTNNWGIFHYEGKSFFGGAVHFGSEGVSQATIEYDGVLGHLALRPRSTFACKIEGGIGNGTLLLGAVGSDSSNARIENASDGRLKILPRSSYAAKIFGDGGAGENGTLQLGPTDDAFNATIQNAGDGDLKITARTGYSIKCESPIKHAVYTVATLPTAASFPYARAFVSDANATTFNSTVAGGGANKVPVWSDGTNWKIG